MKSGWVAIFDGGKIARLLCTLLLFGSGVLLTGCNVSAFAQKTTPEEEYQNQIDQSRLRWATNLCSYIKAPETFTDITAYGYDKLAQADRERTTLKEYTEKKWQKNCVNKKLSRITKMRKRSDERKIAQLLKERLEAKKPK